MPIRHLVWPLKLLYMTPKAPPIPLPVELKTPPNPRPLQAEGTIGVLLSLSHSATTLYTPLGI